MELLFKNIFLFSPLIPVKRYSTRLDAFCLDVFWLIFDVEPREYSFSLLELKGPTACQEIPRILRIQYPWSMYNDSCVVLSSCPGKVSVEFFCVAEAVVNIAHTAEAAHTISM